MKVNTRLKLQCFICQSRICLKSSQALVEICEKFKIFTLKFINSVSVVEGKKLESKWNQSFIDSVENVESSDKKISCCVKCASEVETFCEMWESFESLQGEMVCAVVTISNLTKFQFDYRNKILEQRSPKDCFICQAVPSSKSNSEIETCLKFITLVERFVLNTAKPAFDNKILQMFVEMGRISNSVTVYCCDICLTELVTFCEMYEGLDSLRLEIHRILDRIFNRSKHLRSSVEKCRKQSFPRVKLERLPNLDQAEHEETPVNLELMEVADSVSTNLKAQCQNDHQPEENDFDIEMASSGIPSPSSSLHGNNHNDDENADKSEAAPKPPVNISQSSHFNMGSTKWKTERDRNRDIEGKFISTDSDFNGSCLFCEKKFPQFYRLANHIRSHTGERSFVCSICLQEYSIKRTLLTHRRIHHFGKKQAPTPRISVCELCGKTFVSKYVMQKHKITVHDGIKLKRKNKSNKKYLTSKEVCHICGKILSSKHVLSQHLKLLHQSEIDESLKIEKEFKCPIADCQWAFHYKHQFKRHMLTHTGEKKYQCDLCGKSYSQQYNLRRHKVCHREVRPLVCDHCGKGFNFKYNLKEHVKKHHSSDSI